MATQKTAAKTEPADAFADLFDAVELEDRKPNARKRERESLVVPQKWIDLVESAFKAKPQKRIKMPVTDIEQFNALADLLRAAGDRSPLGLSVTCTARYTGEGDDEILAGLNASVGVRRGGSRTKSADVEADVKSTDGDDK